MRFVLHVTTGLWLKSKLDIFRISQIDSKPFLQKKNITQDMANRIRGYALYVLTSQEFLPGQDL